MSAEIAEVPGDDSDFLAVVMNPLPDDAPEWAVTLNENMGMLASGINQTNASIDNSARIIKAIQAQVGPVVDKLSNHPMFKMFAGGR